MLHISVCDDSVEFIRVFKNQLEYQCNSIFSHRLAYEICDVFNSAEDVLKHLHTSPIDVLFLDIDMPGMNGFELAKRLAAINPHIILIFVSAYDHYVFQSFEFCPLAYLRKNKIAEELPGILNRIYKRVYDKSVLIPLDTTDGITQIQVCSVCYIKAKRNYYIVETESGKAYVCRGTLSQAEKRGRNMIFTEYTLPSLSIWSISKESVKTKLL